MGNPRTPSHLSAIQGSARPGREQAYAENPALEFEKLTELPPAPNWMPNAYAVEEYNRCGALLLANRLLTQGSITTLATYAATHGKIAGLFLAGETPKATLIGQFLQLAGSLGLTPKAASQMRIGAPAAEKKPNAFASNGAAAVAGRR